LHQIGSQGKERPSARGFSISGDEFGVNVRIFVIAAQAAPPLTTQTTTRRSKIGVWHVGNLHWICISQKGYVAPTPAISPEASGANAMSRRKPRGFGGFRHLCLESLENRELMATLVTDPSWGDRVVAGDFDNDGHADPSPSSAMPSIKV
jgi:hypothetical protein